MRKITLVVLSFLAVAVSPLSLSAQETPPSPPAAQTQPPTQNDDPQEDLAKLIPQTDLDAIQKAYNEQAYSRAISLAEQALKKAPQSHKLHTLLGNAHLLNGSPAAAIPFLLKARELGADPDTNAAVLCIAYSSVSPQSIPPNAAVDTCVDAAKRNPKNSALQYRTANLLTDAQRYDDAAPFFQNAFELDPQSLPYATSLTSNLATLKKYQQAFEITTQLIETKHQNSPILYHNAIVYAQRAKLYDEVVKWADLTAERFHDKTFYVHKAAALFNLAQFDEARAVLAPLNIDLVQSSSLDHYYLVKAKLAFQHADPSAIDAFNQIANSTLPQNDAHFRAMFALTYLLNRQFDDAQRKSNLMKTSQSSHVKIMGYLIESILPLFRALDDEKLPTQKVWNDLPHADRQRAAAAFKTASSLAGSPAELAAFIDELPRQGFPPLFVDAFKLVDANKDENFASKSTSRCSSRPRSAPASTPPIALLLLLSTAVIARLRRVS